MANHEIRKPTTATSEHACGCAILYVHPVGRLGPCDQRPVVVGAIQVRVGRLADGPVGQVQLT